MFYWNQKIAALFMVIMIALAGFTTCRVADDGLVLVDKGEELLDKALDATQHHPEQEFHRRVEFLKQDLNMPGFPLRLWLLSESRDFLIIMFLS